MKKLFLFILLLISFRSISQPYGYLCSDINKTSFNIIITDSTYAILLDSYMVVTKLDTIINYEGYSEYVPKNNQKDTLIIYDDGLVDFTDHKKSTTFIIVKRMNIVDEDIEMLNNVFIVISD